MLSTLTGFTYRGLSPHKFTPVPGVHNPLQRTALPAAAERNDVLIKIMTMEIRPYQESDELSVIQLWSDCGLVVPQNSPHRDIRRKLKVQPEMFLVGYINGQIIASVMAGYEGHRGWINYLAVHPNHQGSGIGRRIMEKAEMLLRESGCPKINLQVRSSNVNVIEFYRKLGYKYDNVVSLGKRLVPDE
jgi:ribosomal protein S18 acetylase RimI-like enzyme